MGLGTNTSLIVETIRPLQGLIQVNVDSRDGLAERAEKIDDV